MINVNYLSNALIVEFYEKAIALATTGGKLSDYRLVFSRAIAPQTVADVISREVEPFPSIPTIPYVLADGGIQCCIEPVEAFDFASCALIKQSSSEGLFLYPGEYYQTVLPPSVWVLNFPSYLEVKSLKHFRRNHAT